MADFIIREGNLEPPLTGRLEDADENPIDLSNCTVKLILWRQLDLTTVVNAAALILVPLPANLAAGAPNVKYVWQTGDITQPGIYRGVWEVASGGRTASYPNDDGFTVVVSRAAS